MQHMRISGHGGGGKGGKSGGSGGYNEAPNTLRSKQTMRLLFLVSEGVTGGLKDGAKSIFFDDVPVQNPDGSFNFEGGTFETRNGFPDQAALSGFPAVENEQGVGVEIKQDLSATRAITNLAATAVRVSIQVPQLIYTDPDNGNVKENSVDIAIDRRSEAGTWREVRRDTISGKCTSPYVRAYRIPLEEAGPWYIRVRRLSEDANGTTSNNQTYWSSYTVIEDYRLTYPDSAVLGVTLDAAEFGGNAIPTVSVDWSGIEIEVPSNYDPETRAYAGVWDGTFKRAVTDNPAWIFYDLVVNDRYGLGQYVDIGQVSKWALYTIAQYCDALVDDGFGGKEPRYTFNGAITSRDEAINVLTAFAGVFRGMVYWGTGAVTAVCDKPADPVKLVSQANVVDGTFSYQGSALSARHTQVLVRWFDPENNYKPAIEVVEDPDAVARYGSRQTEIQAIGCCSRGQAHRYGAWLLDTEQHSTEVVTYRAGLDHADVAPGDVVLVADPSYAGVRYGGRIKAVSDELTAVTVDAAVTLNDGETYTLTVVMPDGVLADRPVTNGAGETDELILSEALPDQPVAGAMWILTGSDAAPRPFRVLSITENDKHQFDVSALIYDETKWARVEEGLILEPPSFSTYPTGPLLAPSHITVEEYLYLAGGVSVRGAVTIGWSAPNDTRATLYEVEYREQGGIWLPVGSTTSVSIDLQDLDPGVYSFRVRSVFTALNQRSKWTVLEAVYLSSVLSPPGNVERFNIAVIGDMATLTWSPVDALNLSHYVIRYSPELTGVTWRSSGAQLDHVDATSVQIPTRPGTYLVKAVTRQGVESPSATFIQTTVGATPTNAIERFIEQPAWSGTLDNCFAGEPGLRLANAGDDIYTVVEAGTYVSARTIDLGSVFTSRITPVLSVYGQELDETMDKWPLLINLDGMVGADPSKWNAVMEIRTTDEDPDASEAVWTDWHEAATGDVAARAYQVRLQLSSIDENITPIVARAELTVDMPDRILSGNNIVVPVAGKRIGFDPPYYGLTGVSISAQGLRFGDFYEIANKDESGFDIVFKDQSGTPVERSFDYVAVGYGKVHA
ncbi:host specificity protein J [Martelella mediterranea]|uniref:Putative phage tail protein n=1 Tax=Martelella mediterranea TaxID=293089 RepID=A0A4R3NUW7_9HYPH|nr:phage tail protein [Martelella mediterranea]TCT42792.1 putative phage tail protein [Martelella mediterranea]